MKVAVCGINRTNYSWRKVDGFVHAFGRRTDTKFIHDEDLAGLHAAVAEPLNLLFGETHPLLQLSLARVRAVVHWGSHPLDVVAALAEKYPSCTFLWAPKSPSHVPELGDCIVPGGKRFAKLGPNLGYLYLPCALEREDQSQPRDEADWNRRPDDFCYWGTGHNRPRVRSLVIAARAAGLQGVAHFVEDASPVQPEVCLVGYGRARYALHEQAPSVPTEHPVRLGEAHARGCCMVSFEFEHLPLASFTRGMVPPHLVVSTQDEALAVMTERRLPPPDGKAHTYEASVDLVLASLQELGWKPWTTLSEGKDEAPAVQSAIDKLSGKGVAGGTVILATGQHNLRGTIVASSSGIVLTPGGSGGAAVVLQVPDLSPPRPRVPRPRPTRHLHAVGGLCNRARAIFGYRSVLGPIDVVWSRDDYVSHARFSDVFEPLQGVTFHDDGACAAEDFAPHPDAPVGWQRAFAELRPVESVAREIAVQREALGDRYAAMHVRRTDMVPWAKVIDATLTTDEQYREFVDRHAPLPVYLATDNGETQRKFLDDPRVRIYRPLDGVETQLEHDHRRNGSLADAVVDLFVCAGAKHFLGAGTGTFSHTIEVLRQLRRDP